MKDGEPLCVSEIHGWPLKIGSGVHIVHFSRGLSALRGIVIRQATTGAAAHQAGILPVYRLMVLMAKCPVAEMSALLSPGATTSGSLLPIVPPPNGLFQLAIILGQLVSRHYWQAGGHGGNER